ncbi:hypothetical protein ACFODY_05335 [Sinirhodobacter populi]
MAAPWRIYAQFLPMPGVGFEPSPSRAYVHVMDAASPSRHAGRNPGGVSHDPEIGPDELAQFPWNCALTCENPAPGPMDCTFVTIGPLRGGLWIFAWRSEGNESVRVFSARRATLREERKYEARLDRT